MSSRAYQYVGERQWVDGVPFGSWTEHGDCYTSESACWPGDIDLLDAIDLLRHVLAEYLQHNQIIDGHWYSPERADTCVDVDGRFYLMCEAGHRIVSDYPNHSICTAQIQGRVCGQDIDHRVIPYREISPDENGEAHYDNGPAGPDETALIETLRQEYGL